MALDSVNNGDSGAVARATINAAIAQTDTNTTDIATNAADIATNTADIATNTADIATNTADIVINTFDIATNTADIATNATAITLKQDANAISTLLDRIRTDTATYTVTSADNHMLLIITNTGGTLFRFPHLPTLTGGAEVEIYNDATSTSNVTFAAVGGAAITYAQIAGSPLAAFIAPGEYAKFKNTSTDNWLRIA